MCNKKIFFLSLGLIALTAFNGNAQTRIGSPYSRYGLGDLQSNKYMRNISMGGISYGFRDSTTVNFTNPASYTEFDTTSFVFETGVNSRFVELSTNDLMQGSNYTSLSHLVMGFPVNKWWGASIGLLPFSSVGYKISDYETVPNVGKIKYLYEGSGGLNQFYLGNAFRIKDLSFGFNAAYIFGTLDKLRTVSFPDSVNVLAVRLRNSTLINNFLFTYGLQYQKKLNNGIKIGLGLVCSASTNLNAREDSLAYRFFTAGTGYETIKDTLINTQNTKGKIALPMSIGGGFTIGKSDKWLVGVDYQTQDWSNYSAFGEQDSLKNSWMASVGAEFTPSHTSISNYWKRVHYRIGGRYNQTYLQLRDNQLSEYAVSFGLGFPLKRSKTSINVGFELGQRGTTENNLIKEQFGRVILSFSIYEYWFYKKKLE